MKQENYNTFIERAIAELTDLKNEVIANEKYRDIHFHLSQLNTNVCALFSNVDIHREVSMITLLLMKYTTMTNCSDMNTNKVKEKIERMYNEVLPKMHKDIFNNTSLNY